MLDVPQLISDAVTLRDSEDSSEFSLIKTKFFLLDSKNLIHPNNYKYSLQNIDEEQKVLRVVPSLKMEEKELEIASKLEKIIGKLREEMEKEEKKLNNEGNEEEGTGQEEDIGFFSFVYSFFFIFFSMF